MSYTICFDVRGDDTNGHSYISPLGASMEGHFEVGWVVGYEFDTSRWRHFMPRCDMHPTATGNGCMLPSIVQSRGETDVSILLRVRDTMRAGCILPQAWLQPICDVRI
jgi:hypothetical protein